MLQSKWPLKGNMGVGVKHPRRSPLPFQSPVSNWSYQQLLQRVKACHRCCWVTCSQAEKSSDLVPLQELDGLKRCIFHFQEKKFVSIWWDLGAHQDLLDRGEMACLSHWIMMSWPDGLSATWQVMAFISVHFLLFFWELSRKLMQPVKTLPVLTVWIPMYRDLLTGIVRDVEENKDSL